MQPAASVTLDLQSDASMQTAPAPATLASSMDSAGAGRGCGDEVAVVVVVGTPPPVASCGADLLVALLDVLMGGSAGCCC